MGWPSTQKYNSPCNTPIMMRRAYVSSPFRDKTTEGAKRNIKFAEAYGLLARCMGYKTVVVHTLIAKKWGIKLANKSKDDEVDREITEFNLRELAKCNILVICGSRITAGMAGEINFAIKHHIPVIIMDA